MIRKIERLVLVAVFLVIGFCVSAQDGTYGAYSPYSIYGIGDIAKEGTAFNKSMGGVGIATRNRKFINFTNPAAVTARDSLSFMADFGLDAHNTVFRQGDLRSDHNTFNIYDFVMTFPIYRSSAFMVGLTPFSNVGYDFSSIEKNPEIIGNTGNIEYDSYGNGSVYQAFIGAGVTLWKNLSVGAEAIYYFGNLDKITNMNYSNDSYRSLNSGNEITVRGLTGKFGLQYEQRLGGDMSMIIGATYRLGTNMKGYSKNFRYATQSNVVDSLRHTVDTLSAAGMKFGDEIGIGISVKNGDDYMKLGIALSGGGIRGIAHAGVLKALEDNGIKVDIIGGTSSGSMIAMLYASGYTPYNIYTLFKKYSKNIVDINTKPIIKNYMLNKRKNYITIFI